MSGSPLHILQSCLSRAWGGLEMQSLDETLRLRNRGHATRLACIPGSRLEKEAHAHGLETVPVRAGGSFHPLAIWRLSRFLRRQPIQIIHAQQSRDIATLIPAMRLSGRRIGVVLSKSMGSYIMKKDILHRFTYRSIDRIFAISHVIYHNVLETTPITPDRVVLLHHGVDLERFSLAQANRTGTRRQLGLGDDLLAIGFVGRFSPGKGHEEFLEAARLISRTHPNVRFIVVGEASFREQEYEEQIRSMCKDLGLEDLVTFTGFREDIPDLMAAFDVFAFPSHAESFGGALLEAMAMERPVVSSNCDGVIDIVVDGQTGIFVPPRNAPELAAGLTRLIEDPALRASMGKAGRRRAEEVFDQERQIDRAVEIYREILRGWK